MTTPRKPPPYITPARRRALRPWEPFSFVTETGNFLPVRHMVQPEMRSAVYLSRLAIEKAMR